MDDFKEKTIIKQGMTSFYENNGRYKNPFQQNTDEYNWFERGWTQAQKRHHGPMPGEPGGQPFKSSGGSYGGMSMADKYRNMRDWSKPDDD